MMQWPDAMFFVLVIAVPCYVLGLCGSAVCVYKREMRNTEALVARIRGLEGRCNAKARTAGR